MVQVRGPIHGSPAAATGTPRHVAAQENPHHAPLDRIEFGIQDGRRGNLCR